MTGQQRLSELRDVLACPADANFRALGMGVPSAYFYIEGAFYGDRRHPDSIDYAAPIIRCFASVRRSAAGMFPAQQHVTCRAAALTGQSVGVKPLCRGVSRRTSHWHVVATSLLMKCLGQGSWTLSSRPPVRMQEPSLCAARLHHCA